MEEGEEEMRVLWKPHEDGEAALEPRKEWRVVQRPLRDFGVVPLGDRQRRGDCQPVSVHLFAGSRLRGSGGPEEKLGVDGLGLAARTSKSVDL